MVDTNQYVINAPSSGYVIVQVRNGGSSYYHDIRFYKE
jgi:hypothetical protein